MMNDLLLEAELSISSTAKSGFPSHISLARRYELSGPLIGVGAEILAPPEPTELFKLDVSELEQFVSDLNTGEEQWAAAVVSDTIVVANNLGLSYIPPGTHLPANVVLLYGKIDDGICWRVHGWPPVDRLVTYSQHYGLLPQMTKIVAWQGSSPATPASSLLAPGPVDPFQSVRPALHSHSTSLSVVNGDDPPQSPERWGSARRGHHRLAIAMPDRYAQLAQQLDRAEPPAIIQTLHAAADVTIAAANCALTSAHSLSAKLRHPLITKPLLAVLNSVAASSARDITHRRLQAIVGRLDHAPTDSWGLSAEYAPQWASDVDHAYQEAKRRSDAAAAAYWHASQYDVKPPGEDLGQYYHGYSYFSSNIVAQALEAALLWSADPLPIADIEYAARSVTGNPPE